MRQPEPVTPRSALLRVLISGESDPPEIVRRIRDWTEGRIALDASALSDMLSALESSGLVERHQGTPDRRTGEPQVTYALTPAGRSSAMEVLADSLTRKT